MIILIDNYDSFTYNLAQYMRQLGDEVIIVRNDDISIDQLTQLKPEAIVLSPGPGSPDHAGICMEVVEKLYKKIPILGICLGHQVIAQSFGGKIIRASAPVHGKVSYIYHDDKGMFLGLTNPLQVTRYHSLIVDRTIIPDCLEVSATTNDGVVMALRHKQYPVAGIQAHPEAILTEKGLQLLRNFIQQQEVMYRAKTETAISL